MPLLAHRSKPAEPLNPTPEHTTMISEIGHFALILAFMMALSQSVLPLIGAHRGNAAWMALARPSARGQ